MSNDFNNDRVPQNSIDETRKRKIENFKLNIDKEKALGETDNFDFDNGGGFSGYDLENFDEMPKKRPVDEINSYSNENVKERIARDSKKAIKQQRKEEIRRAKEKGKKNKRTFRFVWIVAVAILGIFLGQIFLVGVNDMLAINRTEESTVTVNIPDKASLNDIAKILHDNGIIDSISYFELYTSVTSSEEAFSQGTFVMRKNMDYEAIVNYLQSNVNRTDTVSITFSEGLNILEITEKLFAEGVVTDKEAFLNMCNSSEFDEDYEFLKNQDKKTERYYRLEGYLYPDTYEFYLNEDTDLTISRFISNYRKRVVYTKEKTSGYEKKVSIEQRAKDTGYTLDQIMTIASIIQAEALNKEDMYYISSVLHNRLKADVNEGVSMLGCDSTVFYPYRNKEDIPGDIRNTFKSTYDTYKILGLPAGAVCNPGMDAIEAAISPEDTNYLYFCHSAKTEDEPAKAYYATNLSDHNYNLYLAGLVD